MRFCVRGSPRTGSPRRFFEDAIDAVLRSVAMFPAGSEMVLTFEPTTGDSPSPLAQMVGLIEWACIQGINPHISWPWEQTVGTHIDVSHIAATPLGLDVALRVKLLEVDWRRFLFEVEVRDDVESVSRGKHERFIIDKAKFDTKVKKWGAIQMTKTIFSVLSMLIIASLAAGSPAAYAQRSPADFTGEPDKTMAAAHESFVKKEMDKAADQIGKAADYVKEEAGKVATGSKEGVKKAGDELGKLGQSVKKGAVKSADELAKTFGKVDHELAKAWHKTADEAKKAGKDSSDALGKAGESLAGAAKWSGNRLKKGTQSSVEAVQKVGNATAKGVKDGTEEVNKWFKGIGEGIEDLGRKL
jgi:predicted thioesterase